MTRIDMRSVLCAGFLTAFTAAGPALAQMTIKEGHATIRSGQDNWAYTFKEYVEKRTGGKLKIDVFPGGQLGQQTQLIQGVQLGTIEVAQVATEQMTIVDPRFDIFASPGVFEDIAHAQRTLHDPQFQKAIWTIGESKNIKIVGFGCESVSDYASIEPIKTLADFRGKKFRVLGSKLETEMLKTVGATGIPMQLGEALPGLQQKAIDGVRAGTIIFVALKFESVARNVMHTGESVICVPKMFSKKWFEGLAPDLQKAMLEETVRAEETNLAYNIDLLAKTYDMWKSAGGVVNELSPSEKAEFRKRVLATTEEVFKENPAVFQAYGMLKAAAARALKPAAAAPAKAAPRAQKK